MKLSDIFDYVLLDSGQFLLGQSDIELNEENFRRLVKQVLLLYGKYRPKTKRFNLAISGTLNTFTDPDIPNWVCDVIPIARRSGGLYNLFQRKEFNELQKYNFIWRYERPKLYVPASGVYDITAAYGRVIEQITPENNDPPYWEVADIDERDDLFLSLLLGKFMAIIGRSRTAFTHQELPVQNSGAELVSEGKEIENTAMENLQEQALWHNAWS